jgi:hypothetical protein
MANEYMSVTDAFKLIANLFNGGRRKLSKNVEAAFGLTDAEKHYLFYKYVCMCVTRSKGKILVQQDYDWASVKAVLKEHCAIRRIFLFLLYGQCPKR